MGRLHRSRKNGKSGSKRPVLGDLSFVELKPKEVENLILEMAQKEDLKSSKIGLRLRDQYGVPSVKDFVGKSISKILEENKLKKQVPEDLDDLVKRYQNIKKHIESNSRDTHNKRSLLLCESKIRRLMTYYKDRGILDRKWGYK